MTNKSFALSIQNLYYDETPFLSIVCRLVVVDVGNTFGYGTYVQCTFHTVLYKNTPWHSLLTENLENGLDKGGVKANITTEYLNADYWSFASECFIMRRICERARQRKTDLIVTSSDEAFFTLTHCGDSLPYQIPVVVSGIKYPDERVFERMPNVSGYVSKTDFDVLLDAAVRMFPSRRELVCLSDSSFLSLKGVKAVEESWERIKSNYPEHELKVLNVQAKSLNSIITSICYDYNAYKLDNIFCSIRDGLITYDTDLRIHFVNRPLLQMLGLSSETYTSRFYEGQMAGSIFRIYMNGENILQDLLKKVRTGKRPIPIPEKAFMQENHQGTYFPVSGEVVPIFANEKMTGMAIVCRNISEEEMQRRFFNMAVEESSIYPWQYNMHMNRFHFPGGLLRRFGYTDDTDLLARDEMDTLIHPEDLLHTRRNFDAILLGNEINSRMSFRLKSVDGSYEWWEFRSTAYDGLTVDTPYMVLGVCQSIQRYKDTEEALIAARDRALQADKLKSAFLANMSHEIRTPLNAIVGFSDLLKDLDAFSPEEVKQFVETININCTLLLALINDILDLSRIESGTMDFKFGAFNLAFIMQEVHESQRLSMPRDVELRIEIPEGEDKLVITDSVRLKQVVNNLINNAKKFTVTGSITFGYVTNREGYTTIFVEDTGSGISEDAQKHIFERFYKEDSFTQGAGLGLSICQTIVDRLHGSISVSSELGKGTRFEVVIPDANE